MTLTTHSMQCFWDTAGSYQLPCIENNLFISSPRFAPSLSHPQPLTLTALTPQASHTPSLSHPQPLTHPTPSLSHSQPSHPKPLTPTASHTHGLSHTQPPASHTHSLPHSQPLTPLVYSLVPRLSPVIWSHDATKLCDRQPANKASYTTSHR